MEASNEVLDSVVDLYMIEEIIAEKNIIVLANYVFGKKISFPVSDREIEKYANAFDEALSQNMFLSVEYDEKRGVIVG